MREWAEASPLEIAHREGNALRTSSSGVVVVPGFRETCPKMNDESSYGPVVALLKKLAKASEVWLGVWAGIRNYLITAA